jgi:hypothetical protein
LPAAGLGIPYLQKKQPFKSEVKGYKATYMRSSLKSIKIKLVFGCHISKIKFLAHVQNKKRIAHQDFTFSHLSPLPLLNTFGGVRKEF